MALSIGQTSQDDHAKTLVLDLSKSDGPSSAPSTADDHAKTVILNFSDRSANAIDSEGNSAHAQTVILDLSKPENRAAPERGVENSKTETTKTVEKPYVPPDVLDDDYRDIGTWIRTIGVKILGDNKDAPDPERLKLSGLMMGVLADASDETAFSALFDTTETVRLKIRSESKDYYGHMKSILYKYLSDTKTFLISSERILQCFELSEAEYSECGTKLLIGNSSVTPEDLSAARKRFEKYSALRLKLKSFTKEVDSRDPENPYVVVALRIVAMIGKLQQRATEADAKEQALENPPQEPGFLGSLRNFFSFPFLRGRSEEVASKTP